jgi:hypothetical protein
MAESSRRQDDREGPARGPEDAGPTPEAPPQRPLDWEAKAGAEDYAIPRETWRAMVERMTGLVSTSLNEDRAIRAAKEIIAATRRELEARKLKALARAKTPDAARGDYEMGFAHDPPTDDPKPDSGPT